MPRLLIQFARYGPYHHARIKSAEAALRPLGWEVIGLETAGTDSTYAWDETTASTLGPKVITAFPGRVHEEITAKDCRRVLHPLLDFLNPDAIASAGWASPDALSCLSWCRKHARRRIVMSETREADGKRVWWRERIKRYLVSRFDGALVGGKSHRDYLVKLGMPVDKIRFGYNVVDNAYFANEALKHQNTETSVPPYFLASNRFIERKNLSRLVESYSSYVQQSAINNRQSAIWPLCLLGDGELKPALIAQCHTLGLTVIESAPWENSLNSDLRPPTCGLVFFPGFRQIDELPRFYAHAGCFIHPALEEPWGLVVNEAMAAGLPVLSGSNVGAAGELVDDGVNGWCFDAENVEEIATYMGKLARLAKTERQSFSFCSSEIINERCPTFAFGRGLANCLNSNI